MKDDARAKKIVPGLNVEVYAADVVLSAVVSFSVVILSIISKSFWIDEILSIKVSSQNAHALVSNLVTDYHPPLYFLLLKIWIAIAGQSEIVLRVFQAMQGIIFMMLSLLLFRKLLPGRRYHPLWLLLITSSELWLFMPMLRYYTLAACLVMFSSLAFFAWLEKNGRAQALLLIFSYVLLLYADYPASVLIAFHFVYVMARNKARLRRLIMIDAVSLALYCPWIMVTIGQVRKSLDLGRTADLNASAAAIPLKMAYSFYSFVLGETSYPFEILSIIIALAVAVAFFASWPARKEVFGDSTVTYALGLVITGIFFTSFMTTFVSTHTSFMATPSRTFFGLPFLFLFFGGIYSKMKRVFFKRLIVAAFLLANVYGISNWVMNRHFMMPVYAVPWKEVVKDVEGSKGIILVDESACYQYYRNARHGVYPDLRSPRSVNDLSVDLADTFSKNQPFFVFLVIMGRESSDPELEKDVVDYVRTNGKKLYERRYLVLDENYRRMKSRILGRDDYDAKLTLLKYELPSLLFQTPAVTGDIFRLPNYRIPVRLSN